MVEVLACGTLLSINLVYVFDLFVLLGPSWLWSYGSLSRLMLWVRISLRARYTTLWDKVCQWLAAGCWFSPGTLVSSTNKADHRHDITEILLKVALNIIKPNQPLQKLCPLILITAKIILIVSNHWSLPINPSTSKFNLCNQNSCLLQTNKNCP